jgi:hypothetical protein
LQSTYKKPTVHDYGSLLDITSATGFTSTEDSGNKLLIHHIPPPSTPSG